jgi:hypothetical protein
LGRSTDQERETAPTPRVRSCSLRTSSRGRAPTRRRFFARAGADAPKDYVPALRRRVDERARAQGWSKVRWDNRLSQIAQAEAQATAKGQAGRNDEQLRSAVFGLGYESMVQHQIASASFRSLSTLDVWESAGKRYVGYGIARTPDGRSFVLVVYLAR